MSSSDAITSITEWFPRARAAVIRVETATVLEWGGAVSCRDCVSTAAEHLSGL